MKLYAFERSDVQWEQRTASIGMLSLQNGHSFCVRERDGFSRFILLISLIRKKSASATIRNSMIVLINDPYAITGAPAALAATSEE